MWQRLPLGSPELRTRFDAWSRPSYAYGVWRALDLARSLDLDGISVVDFGVAGGSGLVALESIAHAMAARAGASIDVFGFDSGSGNPPPSDFRDLPYVWAEGDYRMDEQKLKGRLHGAHLLLGHLERTIPAALER